MIIALLLWTALVALVYFFGGAVIGFLTPGAAWLQANPDLAVWIEPALGFAGTLGVSAVIIAWLAGAFLIVLIGRLRPARRLRDAISYDEWQNSDGGAPPPPPRRGWRPRPPPVYSYDDDDGNDDRRRSRRRRRDDDDDDDDDD